MRSFWIRGDCFVYIAYINSDCASEKRSPYESVFTLIYFLSSFLMPKIASAIEITIPTAEISGMPLLVFGCRSTMLRRQEPIKSTQATTIQDQKQSEQKRKRS